MNQLLELSPLILFLIAYKLWGIYTATAVLMAACVVVLILHRVRTGTFKTMHVITAAVVVGLGALTLLLHDARFIQWKPTVLMGLTAVAFLASMVLGKQPLVRRMFEGVFTETLQVSPRAWLVLNSLWAGWFALLAILNIYVAQHFSENAWVNFKVYGITPATMLFMIPQVLWLSSKIKPDGTPEELPVSTARSRTTPAPALGKQLYAHCNWSLRMKVTCMPDTPALSRVTATFGFASSPRPSAAYPTVARHRLVYAAVGDLMQTDIHALAIDALAPE